MSEEQFDLDPKLDSFGMVISLRQQALLGRHLVKDKAQLAAVYQSPDLICKYSCLCGRGSNSSQYQAPYLKQNRGGTVLLRSEPFVTARKSWVPFCLQAFFADLSARSEFSLHLHRFRLSAPTSPDNPGHVG